MAALPSVTEDRLCLPCESRELTSSDNATRCHGLPFQMNDSGLLVIEAEHYDDASPNGSSDTWTEADDDAASGERMMEVTPNDGSSWTSDVAATSPSLVFNVNFTTTGTFTLSLRGESGSESSTSDSCFAGIDGVPLSAVFDFPQPDGYTWVGHTVEVTTEGAHTVTLWGREDGIRIDKIVVSRSGTLPTGTGPSESPRD
jgi:Gylcosyl hydrolase family 115 C-terminal domain